ncbi:forkhead box protein N1 [Girardinichthys multiradiatus]|uniref:forkhead box protein N1 n=1 Tax=Girardinichthys multiradiatus TaxID=208333 RepID=UPI001FAB5569|nr:forkhead box protein N1 [Girardinichthys multiradiatus]XP_047246919.1 forkhead box protein N1 [Girardinichthys multiradiatus]
MANSQIKEGKDICFPQQESNNLSLRSTALNRRHSSDGTISSGSGSERSPADRFHPYRRQFSDGAGEAARCLQQSTSSFSSLQEVSSPDTRSCSCDVQTTWGEYNGSIQSSYSELPSLPVEPYSSLSQSYASYSPVSPMQQVSAKLYPNADQSDSSKYSLQSLSIQPHQERSTEALFPKPIYSYSILIFMALKNSKTGSLPVSEIYSFMTEHFPYFKTAPDGWKNSVRHNLSLNKCFEKVENKNGSTSRKGCLWALNPAKVEKMQEELHKWRRKDPQTIRRSMAKPEDFDHLLGEKPDKLRSLPPYPNTNTATSKRVGPMYSPTRSPLNSAQPAPAYQPNRQSDYSHRQPHQPYYLPHTTVQPSNPFALYSPCGQQPAAGVPSPSGCLNSPIAGKMPPVYSLGLLGEYNVGLRGMHELLQDGDTSYDIDTLNPSLTDLQLQGNLWEELREDSLVSEPNGPTTTPSTFCPLQGRHLQTSCPQAPLAFSPTFEGSAGPRCKAAYEDEDAERSCWNGLHPVGYSGLESLAGYLTSCTTSVSLM